MNEFDFISRAREIRKRQLAVSEFIPDEKADEFSDFFPYWTSHVEVTEDTPSSQAITTEEGRTFIPVHYNVGDRRRYGEFVYRCIQSHDSQEDWSPEAAASLWAKILTDPTGNSILEWEQPNSTNPYQKGDKVTHNGKTYESLCDNNVWEPGAIGTESLWKVIE